MATPEALNNDVEKELMRIETLTTVCIQCGGKFIIRPSGEGNVVVPAEGTLSECPNSDIGVHILNLMTL